MASVSHLGRVRRGRARRRTKQAAMLGLARRGTLHYTQSRARWQGISQNLQSRLGRCPHFADCSSFATWCLWNALHVAYGKPDIVNGQHWRAGYTGTLLGHGKRVHGRRKVGDLVIYGRGFPGEHVAVYVGRGMVVSHGSEAGPFLLPWNYRRDVIAVRRYI